MKINLLDLFSGIGGFHLGLEKAGYKINSYFSEVDKYAIEVYKNNFKNSNYVGSVTDVQSKDLPKINAITFGSPCQDFSLAGKRKGMQGSRSSLISEAIRLISECKPDFFIWENVKGTFSSNSGEDFWAIIQAFANIGGYRLEWQLLNTKWFLPQNRERIYLVGCLGGKSGGQIFPIGQCYKRDFVEKETSACTTTSYHKGVNFDNQLIKIKSATKRGYELATPGDSVNYSTPTSKTRRGRVEKGVSQTLDTGCEMAVVGDFRTDEGYRERKENYVVIPKKVYVRKYDVDVLGLQKLLKNHRSKSLAQIATELKCPKTMVEHWFRTDKSFSIPSPKFWLKLKEILKIEENKFDESILLFEEKEGNFDMTERVYLEKSNAPTLTNAEVKIAVVPARAREDEYRQPIIQNQSKIRRLTPLECERLQGFPDNWTKYGTQGIISDTQRYKMCGNAVTVDVVEAVAKQIIKIK